MKFENVVRQKFILNTLLISSIFLLSLASIFVCIDFIVNGPRFEGLDPTDIFLVLGLFVVLYFLSRKGYTYFCSIIFLLIFYALATLMGYIWGVDLPSEILLYTLIIVMTGSLMGTRFAFLATIVIGITISFICYLHNFNIVPIDRHWAMELWGPGELIVAITIFFAITIVSWLSNREIEKLFVRAKQSEAELKKERDSLEIKIDERTKELKEAQFEKMTNLYRFAEFGRLSAGIFHDLVNPLNAVSLNMEKVKSQKTIEDNKVSETKFYLDCAISAAKKMGDLIGAIKKQILRKDDQKIFSLNEDVKEIVDILAYKAQRANVKIIFNASENIEMVGDSIKFNQIVLNLLANAIDAYAGFSSKNNQIIIGLSENEELITLIVKDFGIGIPKENLDKIFESFFTTKSKENGLGIGLPMVKKFVEKDFNGTIQVESDKINGTNFIIKFFKNGKPANLIDQLKSYQQDDGSFLDDTNSPSILYTSLILSCLKDNTDLLEVRKRAVNFLLSKNDNWKFSEDLNINFCILAAIAENNKDAISGAGLGKILMFLTSIELKEGGPYCLQNGIIDPVANASIARFLACYDVSLPSLEQFKVDSINNLVSMLHLKITPDLSLALHFENSNHFKKEDRIKNVINFNEQENVIMDLIFKKAEGRFAGFSKDFQILAMDMIKKVLDGNIDKQMSLMALYTRQSLGDKANKISDDFIAELGLINIFFWAAFIIYDDFWDEDESARPRLLPVANLFARTYIDFFDSILPEKTGFKMFFHKLMDDLDLANSWETINCRTKIEQGKFLIPENIPNYGNYDLKFQPASGHILGPVSVLVEMGYEINSSEIRNLIEYFRNYLIAMQINDDIHDWEEDMKRGHLSTVVTMLLEDLNWPKKEIDLEKEMEEIKKIFWFKTMSRAAETAILYAEKSRQALNKINIIENKQPLERFINMNRDIAERALKEQKESVEFLKDYKID